VHVIYQWLHRALWIAFCLYWFAAAFRAKPVKRKETILSRLSHIAPLGMGIWLLVSHGFPGTWLNQRIVPWTPPQFWIGSALLVAGLSLAVLARRHLGGNWSGTVTLKQQHELIRTGPYRWTRHPIYTGLLLAIAGSATADGEWRDVIAVALIAAAFTWKLRIEERFLAEQFPGEYDRYRAEVPALIPSLRRRPRVTAVADDPLSSLPSSSAKAEDPQLASMRRREVMDGRPSRP
jgi:protein-S-isoprenylcysteine O-methyltransferase Ste14